MSRLPGVYKVIPAENAREGVGQCIYREGDNDIDR